MGVFSNAVKGLCHFSGLTSCEPIAFYIKLCYDIKRNTKEHIKNMKEYDIVLLMETGNLKFP